MAPAAAAAAALAPPALALTEQAAAARAPLNEALVLIAAAGTGKTFTMLERVAFAVEEQVCACVCGTHPACCFAVLHWHHQRNINHPA